MDARKLKEAAATFIEESEEHIDALEQSLMELKSTGPTDELVNTIFRMLHTIKGSGSMFGFAGLVDFTHRVESVFDGVRNGRVRVTDRLADLTVSAVDAIRRMVASIKDGAEASAQEYEGLLAEIEGHAVPSCGPAEGMGAGGTGASTYRIRFTPPSEMMLRGLDPSLIIENLSALGKCMAIAHPQAIPPLRDYNPELLYNSWDLILTTECSEAEIRDVFAFVDFDAEVKVSMVCCGSPTPGDEEYRRLGEILVERGDITKADLQRILGSQKRLGDIVIESALASPSQVEAALKEQRVMRDLCQERMARSMSSTVRVPSEKLDQLVNLVGELVTLQAHLTQRAEQYESGERRFDAEDILMLAEDLERLTSNLHGSTMSIRMVPIESVFSKLRRHVYDLSRTLGREVAFTTEGDETELDKSVIEHIADPLMHIIRNAIDHGMEAPAVREKQGKPRRGSVHVSAEHADAHVVIRVRDDGKGMDADQVFAAAVDKGIVQPGAKLTEQEKLALVMSPGFSTASTVTDISGRGVGMDVVRRSLDAMRGTVTIASAKGRGCTITLQIPLTMAIIDGLLVKVSENAYVIPLAAVEECIEMDGGTASQWDRGRRLINVRGSMIPYISLRSCFGHNGGVPAREHVVVVGMDDERVGFVVDAIVGKHQTVIKSMNTIYRNVAAFSGATILGDASVALILDVRKLYEVEQLAEAGMVASQREWTHGNA